MILTNLRIKYPENIICRAVQEIVMRGYDSIIYDERVLSPIEKNIQDCVNDIFENYNDARSIIKRVL